MTGCSAPFCNNSLAKGYVMKVFPRDLQRRAQWAKNVARKDWMPTDRSYLCEVHFTEDMWEHRVDNKPKLKPNAIPTIFGMYIKKKPLILIQSKVPANMSNCSVESCKNHRRSTALHGKDISYHRFPKDEEIRKKWLKSVQPRHITENSYVCSVHFLEEDFERNLQAELLDLPMKRRLKPTAVPSLYMDKSDEDNSLHTVKETSLAITYSGVQTNGEKSQNITTPELVATQGIDNLECKNYEPLMSKKIILVNSKSTQHVNSQKDSEDAQPLLEDSDNYINSIANSEISQGMEKQKSRSKNEDSFRCRTCFEDIQMGYFLMNVAHVTKTIKEMIVLCVPQMAPNLSNEDVVCNKCLDAIQFCVKFIENCLEVEEKMQTLNRKENGSEYDQENCNSPNVTGYVQIDHDYVIKSEPKKIETSKNLETVQPTSEKNLQVNQLQETSSNVDETCTKSNQPFLKCPSCDRLFKLQKFLLSHIRRVHNDETQEDIIELSSNENANRQVEVVQKTAIGKFKCSNCEKLFKTENYLSIHMRKVHNVSKVGVGKYVCKFCKRTFMRESSYKVHLKKHNQREPDVCRVCGLRFHNKQELAEHRRRHGIICSVCFKGFSSRDELKEHREIHPNIFFCKECGKGFKMKKSLMSHAEVHSAYCFYCSECGKGFKSNAALRYHQIIHDPEKKLKCDKCSSTFQDKRKLLLHHKVVHEKIREYQCARCGIQFGFKTALKYHIRLTHLKLKSYQCETCGKRFGRRDYLKVHTDHHCKKGSSTKQTKKVEDEICK